MQILVVHLMRFRHDGARTAKLNMEVAFTEELELQPRMFADSAPIKRAQYRLLATVQHLGARLGPRLCACGCAYMILTAVCAILCNVQGVFSTRCVSVHAATLAQCVLIDVHGRAKD